MKRFSAALARLLLAISIAFPASASTTPTKGDWALWARRVGQSETPAQRDAALTHLKKEEDLANRLLLALGTEDRALALDVIGALNLEVLLPDMFTMIEKDRDGFLTLAISSMITEKSKKLITDVYVNSLATEAGSPTYSPAALVAMLEPIGRLGVKLPEATLSKLLLHSYPEVRAAALSVVRTAALTYKRSEQLKLVVPMLQAHEFQIRLQAVSVFSEVLRASGVKSPQTRDQLSAVCARESHLKVKEHCNSFLQNKKVLAASITDSFSERSMASIGAISRRHVKMPASVPAAGKTAVAPCEKSYRRLFSRGTVNIRMVFGYKDTRPARFVGDRHERLSFVQDLLKPCDGARMDCGFARNQDNADLFTKKIDGYDGKKVKVQLWVAHSSVSSDDRANREDPFQIYQSGYAKTAFYTGIRDADMVFYNGHSRFGGGPDFDPPHLTEGQQVDVVFYQQQRPGFTKITDAMQVRAFSGNSEQQLKILGLFSCASTQHFSEEIRQNGNIGLISSRSLIYYSDALANSLSSLSAVLEKRCRKDFNVALRNSNPVKGMRIQGFFAGSTK